MSPHPDIRAPFTIGAQLDARAGHPEIAGRVALRQRDRSWTYARFRDESVRVAHFLRRRLGPCAEGRPGHVAMLMENHLELLALYAGCGYAGFTLFGINSGLRGDALAGVINQSGARLLVVDEKLFFEVERIQSKLGAIAKENLLVLPTQGGPRDAATDYLACLESEIGPPDQSLESPDVEVRPEDNLMVIYTSGTTGLPKGINNNHFKVHVIGLSIARMLELGPDDVGYGCMPLFHSNSIFLGFHPVFDACGTLCLRERFSASAFVPDVLRYGVSYWNYVGEPVHYILAALEAAHGGDPARIEEALTHHPDNRLRYALGNGASPPDIDRFMAWFGLEEMFELYGSTEAAISTFRRHTDPRGSVGEVTDERVQILDSEARPCPPAELDADGKITNYAEAVGEICRIAGDTALFQGYFENANADSDRYRDGVYHSGDLGHILIVEDRRYLHFDGRTDDWIRKDGENFSAAQVGRLLQEHPDVAMAAAYGAPCAVSDELVMAALKLRPGAGFDPAEFFAFYRHQIEHGSMDPKWLPDFIRIVDDFEFTETQKILVRNLKRVHFDRRRLPDADLYWRERGDDAYREFRASDYEDLRRVFEKSERAQLLDC